MALAGTWRSVLFALCSCALLCEDATSPVTGEPALWALSGARVQDGRTPRFMSSCPSRCVHRLVRSCAGASTGRQHPQSGKLVARTRQAGPAGTGVGLCAVRGGDDAGGARRRREGRRLAPQPGACPRAGPPAGGCFAGDRGYGSLRAPLARTARPHGGDGSCAPCRAPGRTRPFHKRAERLMQGPLRQRAPLRAEGRAAAGGGGERGQGHAGQAVGRARGRARRRHAARAQGHRHAGALLPCS